MTPIGSISLPSVRIAPLVGKKLLADNGPVHRTLAIALTCAYFINFAKAVREIVIIEDIQPAQQVEGVVLDPLGVPVPNMTVTDRSEQWVSTLRSTTTDRKGHFHFARQHGKTVYYLRFDQALWNPLELRLKLDKNAPQRGITATPQIGG